MDKSEETPNLWPLYNFYKSPDQEDCLEKAYYATKYAGTIGVIFGLMDIGGVTYPRTISHGIIRMLHYVPVHAMMGFSFASTVCITSKIRKKDDFFNHAFAGMVAGSVFGVRHSSAVVGGRIGGIIAVCAATLKYMSDENIPFYKQRRKNYAVYNPHYDFSIKMYEDPGRPLDP